MDRRAFIKVSGAAAAGFLGDAEVERGNRVLAHPQLGMGPFSGKLLAPDLGDPPLDGRKGYY